MSQLLAATALTVGCSKEEPLDIKKDEGKSVAKKADPTAEPEKQADAAPSTVPTPTGYAVVDPLPPPACPGVAASITASATNAAGEIELKLSAPTFPASAYEKPTPPATTPGNAVLTVTGGRIVGSSYPGGALVVKIIPESGAASLFVYISTKCGPKHARVFAYLDLTKIVAGKVPVTLSDSF
ncbi:MAG: hypothetical protein ACXVEF_27365 [Polyangiales bacterium]